MIELTTHESLALSGLDTQKTLVEEKMNGLVNIWIASMLTLYSRYDNTRYFR